MRRLAALGIAQASLALRSFAQSLHSKICLTGQIRIASVLAEATAGGSVYRRSQPGRRKRSGREQWCKDGE